MNIQIETIAPSAHDSTAAPTRRVRPRPLVQGTGHWKRLNSLWAEHSGTTRLNHQQKRHLESLYTRPVTVKYPSFSLGAALQRDLSAVNPEDETWLDAHRTGDCQCSITQLSNKPALYRAATAQTETF